MEKTVQHLVKELAKISIPIRTDKDMNSVASVAAGVMCRQARVFNRVLVWHMFFFPPFLFCAEKRHGLSLTHSYTLTYECFTHPNPQS